MVCPRSSITMNFVFVGCLFCCFSSLQSMKKNNGTTEKKKLKSIYKNKFAFPLSLGEKSPDDPYVYLLELKSKLKNCDTWSNYTLHSEQYGSDNDDDFNWLSYGYDSEDTNSSSSNEETIVPL